MENTRLLEALVGRLRVPAWIATLAATSAAFRSNSRFADYDRTLRERGKPHKLALIEILRKIPAILNAMIRDDRVFPD